MRESYRKFKVCRTDVDDEEGQGYKSVATEDIVQRFDEVVRETCRITIITGLYVEFSEVQDLICSLLLLNIQATENFVPVGSTD